MNDQRLQFLRELKIISEADKIPNVTEQNARFLHFLVGLKQAKAVLEIGTANGYSTIWLADAVEKINGKITTVDHSELSRSQALENFTTCELNGTIESILGPGRIILPTLNKKFDLIFVDAIKKDYAELWHLCKPLMKPDTLVVFDDVLKFPDKTKKFHAIMATETDYERVIVPTDEDDGIMLVQMK